MHNYPENWKQVPFASLAENITVRIDNPSESGLEYYLGLEHLDGDEMRIKRVGTPDEVNATKFICQPGDIIFGKRRAYLRKCARTDKHAVVSAHSMVLRAKENNINKDFLPWLMQSSIFWKTANAISEGSLSPTIKWKTLADQKFFIPPKEEQQKIADILWSIEDHIAATEELISKTETLKKTMLNELLTKGIGHTEFKETEIGLVPVKWKVVKLDDICQINIGKTPSRNISKYWTHDKKNIWLNIADMTSKYVEHSSEYISDTAIKECNCRIIPKGTILMSFKLTLGRMAIAQKDVFSNEAIANFPIKNIKSLDPLFLYHKLSSLNFDKLINVAAKGKTLNKAKLKEISFALPLIDEQNSIREKLELLDQQIEFQRNNFQDLKLLRKKLTNDLVIGNLMIKAGDV